MAVMWQSAVPILTFICYFLLAGKMSNLINRNLFHKLTYNEQQKYIAECIDNLSEVVTSGLQFRVMCGIASHTVSFTG